MNIKYSRIFITLLLICLVLTIPCYASMYAIKDIDGKTICLTNINKLSQEQIESGCTISSLTKSSNSTDTQPKVTEAKLKAETKELESQPRADIVFIDSTNRLSDGGGYYYVEGILKNKGKGTAYHIEVEVRALDKDDKLVSIDKVYAYPTTIASGKEATYQVMVRYNSKIDNFDKTVYWNNSP